MKIEPFKNPVYVTRPFMPPFEEFCEGLKEIWKTQWLTNNGPILRRFSDLLSRFFGTQNISLFTNGTLALQIALQGMEISGEVITTPFSFVATTHVLSLNRIKPVFVDIEPDYYTLDPERVEAAITPSTSAILAVHVYGHPCQIDHLSDIANRYSIKLIFDSAHAFGVKIGARSIADFGDLSLFSLHATKLYHALEGGALVFKQDSLKETFNYLKNFGFKNELEVAVAGTNAKMNEIQALMGIQVFPYLEAIIQKRSTINEVYRRRLVEIPGIRLVPTMPSHIQYNYAYMPVEIDEREFGISRDALYEKLKLWNIFSRRYFYPLICDYACYRNIGVTDPLVVARRAADHILTLPIYDSLQISDVETICDIIRLLHFEKNCL